MPQRGFVSIELVAASALALVLFVMGANLFLGLYARTVARAAVSEGVRSAVSVDVGDPARACRARAGAVVDDLLRGELGRDATVGCEIADGQVRARVTVPLSGWGLLPEWAVQADAIGERER